MCSPRATAATAIDQLGEEKTQFRRVYYFQTEISPLQQHAALINPLTLADDYTRFQTSALLLSPVIVE